MIEEFSKGEDYIMRDDVIIVSIPLSSSVRSSANLGTTSKTTGKKRRTGTDVQKASFQILLSAHTTKITTFVPSTYLIAENQICNVPRKKSD